MNTKKECKKCKESKEEIQFSPGKVTCKKCCSENAINKYFHKDEKGRLRRNPILKPERVKRDDRDKFLYIEDWEELCTCVDDKNILLIFDLCQSCGLRIQECLAITGEDIEFRRGILLVRTLKKRIPEKNDIWVRPDLLKKLQSLNVKPEEKYFYVTYNETLKALKQAVKKLNLSDKLGTHALRRLCGMRLSRTTGGNMFAVKMLLRHARSDITEKYMALSPGDRKLAWEKSWEAQPWIWK